MSAKKGRGRERSRSAIVSSVERGRGTTGSDADRRRQFSPENVSKANRKDRLGEGGLFERFQVDGNEVVLLKRDGFLDLRKKWAVAREKYLGKGVEMQVILDQFPRWAKNVPGLLEALQPIIQNEQADDGDFIYFMERSGFISSDLAKRLDVEDEEVGRESFVREELKRIERERVVAKERRERAELLQGKILEKLKEVYGVEPQDVYITDRASSMSPYDMRIDKDKWGEEIPSWGRMELGSTGTSTRLLQTEMAVVGDDLYVMDLNEYGTGHAALKRFVADHEGGVFLSLGYYEKAKVVQERHNVTSAAEEKSSLVIYDPESYINGI